MAKLAAIALLFLAGVLLRRIGWLDARHGTRLSRIVATVGLPALIIGAVGRVPLEPALLALPASAVAVIFVVGVLARATAYLLGLDRPATGALLVSAMAMNLAFVFPFVFLARGPQALTHTVIFDAGNAVAQWTLVYPLAARYGGHAADARAIVGRMALAPPFLALVVALQPARPTGDSGVSRFSAILVLGP